MTPIQHDTPLPSLRALRAFEALGRHGSVSRAAASLHLTHGAVSRQVKLLEDQLGVALVEKQGRGLRLTDAGRELADATGFHLGALSRVCAEVARTSVQSPFVLSCPGSFLARWFIPRLARLKQALPQLELHLTAGEEGATSLSGVDGVLRFQRLPEEPPSAEVTRVLGQERVGPVLSPGLDLHGIGASAPPAELPQQEVRQQQESDCSEGVPESPPDPRVLLGHALLHTRSRPSAWGDWSRRQGIAPERLTMGQGFEHLNYLLEATLVGLGVGIAPDYLVEEDVRAGRLVAPWGFVATDARLVLGLAAGQGGPATRWRMNWPTGWRRSWPKRRYWADTRGSRKRRGPKRNEGDSASW